MVQPYYTTCGYRAVFFPPLVSLSPPPGKGKKRDAGNNAVIAVVSHLFAFLSFCLFVFVFVFVFICFFFFFSFFFYTSSNCIADSVPM